MIYHERQELLRCGIHALNNALQLKVFTKEAFDIVCEKLQSESLTVDSHSSSSLKSWLWNPHKAPFGLGNYDVNVLMLVLEEKGYDLQWIDKRQTLSVDAIPFQGIIAILCNIVTTSILLKAFMEQRHWFAIRQIDGKYINLDSKLPAPIAFDTEDDCFQFLTELVATGECEIFVIRKKTNDE